MHTDQRKREKNTASDVYAIFSGQFKGAEILVTQSLGKKEQAMALLLFQESRWGHRKA